jgi:hypothetical protein
VTEVNPSSDPSGGDKIPLPGAPPATLQEYDESIALPYQAGNRSRRQMIDSPVTKDSVLAKADVHGEFKEEEVPEPGTRDIVETGPLEPLESRREWTRAALAGGLMVLLAAVILIILLTKSAQDAKELLGLVMAPLVGLVGAATGFYYGGKNKD